MIPIFDQSDRISLQELDDYLRIKIGLIDGMTGDLSGIYPGATKVENIGGGKIKINDQEKIVYTHPSNHPVSMITGLSTVATSGSYADLTGVPTTLPASDVYTWAKQPTKPIYTPAEVSAIPASKLGVANGAAGLDSMGKVPLDQLPDNLGDLATTGEIPVSQLPRLEITEKLKDNDSKMLIWGNLNATTLSQINITLEELAAAN